jgi:RNA polymerase sigma-70 factor (ECF subfamily)
MEDSAIVALFEARDESAISESAAKYGSLCRHIAGNILQSREDVEECVNDTWLAVWNAIGGGENPESLPAFVCKVARNQALKRVEYNSSQKRNANFSVSLSELEECVPNLGGVVDEVEAREVGKHISDFLRGLSFEDRNVFLRKYFVGESVHQIATLFGFTESKVKSSLHRTRKKLKKELIKKGVEI